MKRKLFTSLCSLLLALTLFVTNSPLAYAEGEDKNGTEDDTEITANILMCRLGSETANTYIIDIDSRDTSGNPVYQSLNITGQVMGGSVDTTYKIEWISDNMSVAKFEEPTTATVHVDTSSQNLQTTGKLTGVAPGKTNIYFTVYDGETLVATSSSQEITVSGITIANSAGRTTVAVGSTLSLNVTAYGNAASEQNSNTNLAFSWSSSNVIVASVTSSTNTPTYATVTGSGEGTSVITCSGESAAHGNTYTATFTVEVVPNSAAVINADLTDGKLILSSVAGQISDNCVSLMASSLIYITNLSVSPSEGTLYYTYTSEADTGSGVSSGRQFTLSELKYISFVPKSGYTGTATIKYEGYTENGLSYLGEIAVAVSGTQATQTTYSVSIGETVTFSASDFSSYCEAITGRSVYSVKFTPPSSSYGMLYYNYTRENVYGGVVDSSTSYYRTKSPYIDEITFVPSDSFNGSFSIPFTAYDTAGSALSGTVLMYVVNPEANTVSAGISYTVRQGRQIFFDPDDFSRVCAAETGYQLDYITFAGLPGNSIGTVYCGSTKALASDTAKYYLVSSTQPLSTLNFVASSAYTGTFTIYYSGYNTQGTRYSGTIKITVTSGSSLSLTVKSGERVYFDAEALNDACYDNTGYQLSYIRISELPDEEGTLYYGVNEISTMTAYHYLTGANLIRNLCFLADINYTGKFTIPFSGFDVNGTQFSDVITVTVSANSTIKAYTLYSGESYAVKRSIFSTASYDETGAEIKSVRFNSIPASSQGILYFGDGETRVATDTSYLYDEKLANGLVFTANETFTGTVTVLYTGTNTRYATFTGTLTFIVEDGDLENIETLTYSTSGEAVTFSGSELTEIITSHMSGTQLTFKFAAPDPSAGKLYIDYSSPTNRKEFSESTSMDSSAVSRLSFVPKAEFEGNVYLSYTAANGNGGTRTGIIHITVTKPDTSAYFNDMSGSKWSIQAVDFLARYGTVKGIGNNQFNPKGTTKRGDYILVLSRVFGFADAGLTSYTDVKTTDYYAAAIASAKAAGVIAGNSRFYPANAVTFQDAAVYLYRCLCLDNDIEPGTESDLSGFVDGSQVSSYAVEAVGALVKLGVIIGDSNNMLNPTSSLTRAQMALMLHRALT